MPPDAAGFTNDPNPPPAANPAAAGGRGWLWEPQLPACAFSFSRSLILFPPAPEPADLLAAAEPRDIDQRSSNPLPVPFFAEVDAGAKDGEAVDTGDVTADRAEAVPGLMTGIGAYAGAIAGVELGRACDEAAANAPND